MFKFFKKAFSDMKESAKAQHEVDRANFQAAKTEAKANYQEAKAMSRSSTRKVLEQEKRDEQIAAANQRKEAAQARLDHIDEIKHK